MKKNLLSLINCSLVAVFLAVIFFYIYKFIQPELIYHLQQPAFNSSRDFFKDFLSYPGGLTFYTGNFLSQFFYFNVLGSVVILTTGLLISLFFYLILNSFNKSNSNLVWISIPFIIFIGVTNDYYLSFYVAVRVLVIFASTWALIYLLKKKINPFLLILIFSPLVYYLTGSGYMLIFTTGAIIMVPMLSGKIKTSLFFILFSIVYAFLIEYFAFKYVFSVAPYNAFFALLPEVAPGFYLSYIPTLLFYFFCLSLPLLSILFLLYNAILNATRSLFMKFGFLKLKPVLYSFSILLVACMSYFLIYGKFNEHKKNIVMSDFYCYNENWEGAIMAALSEPEYDIIINYNYNRAINHTRYNLEMFFDYPQYLGTDAVFPDRISSPQLNDISSDIYFDLGYISGSQHWANEALTINPYNIRSLKRLVLTHLILGNYNGARKYLDVLEGNFLAKDFVKKYNSYIIDTSLISKDSLIIAKRGFLPDNISPPDNVTNRFYDLISKNSNNQKAFEHLLLYYLLDNNLREFFANLQKAKKFYDPIPEIFEQASLMYLVMTDPQKTKDYTISDNVLKVFSDYTNIMRRYGRNREAAKSALSEFSNTYMFYYMFNSPKVTKLRLEIGTDQSES